MLRRCLWFILLSEVFFSLYSASVVNNTTNDLSLPCFAGAYDEDSSQSTWAFSVINSDNEPLESQGCVYIPAVVFLDLRPARIKGFADVVRQVSLHGVRFYSPIAGVTSLPDMKQLYGDESRWITLKSLLC